MFLDWNMGHLGRRHRRPSSRSWIHNLLNLHEIPRGHSRKASSEEAKSGSRDRTSAFRARACLFVSNLAKQIIFPPRRYFPIADGRQAADPLPRSLYDCSAPILHPARSRRRSREMDSCQAARVPVSTAAGRGPCVRGVDLSQGAGVTQAELATPTAAGTHHSL